MNLLRRLFRLWSFNTTPRAKRIDAVRHYDENSAAYRRAVMENQAEVRAILGAKRG